MDLSDMSRAELMALQGDIEKQLKTIEKAERKAALAAAAAAAREHGFSLDELTQSGAKVKPATPAKYRDPASGKTWSGRGRRPAWLVDVADLSPYEI